MAFFAGALLLLALANWLLAPSLAKRNYRDAALRGANLAQARLAGVDLSGADLRDANLTGADLRKANLRRAVLHNADLTGADLQGADLTGAVFDSRTRWPKGVDPRQRGALFLGLGPEPGGTWMELQQHSVPVLPE